MVGRGDFPETTRLIGKATLVINIFVIKMWMCGLANSDYFIEKSNHLLSILPSITLFLRNASADTAERNTDDSSTVRISPPFKDRVATNVVLKQLRDLSHKILPTLQPVFVSKKLGQDLKPKEIKPSIVNRQCVIYRFSCDLCDTDYVGYTARHLHQRIVHAEHK